MYEVKTMMHVLVYYYYAVNNFIRIPSWIYELTAATFLFLFTAATNGDPHLVTFDGTAFSFNGHGEYILLSIVEIINFIFQGRMEPITDSQGRETKATALTALVVRETGSDTVQVIHILV